MEDILILTTEEDISTNLIIDWLNYLNPSCNIKRINTIVDLISEYSISKSYRVFLRKYRHLLQNEMNVLNCFKNQSELYNSLENLSKNELGVLFQYLIESKINNVVGNKENITENKLLQLEIAQEVGLTVPKTLVTSCKKELIEFKTIVKDIIVKPLSNAVFYEFKDELFGSYTRKVDDCIIEDLPESFFPCLFQEEIPKLYEIRTFIFYDQCFSMCIFSQQNSQTSSDFRMYSLDTPNRTVPYKLSQNIENKLLRFMKKMNLNTGSVDFIIDKHENIYFLEVNPEGQFGMVSAPCNYNLEKIIANKILAK